MVKIRLKRGGAKKRPFYRIVVHDVRNKRDGKDIDIVGYYDPLKENDNIKIDEEKVIYWYNNGAKYTDTVGNLLKKKGILKKLEKKEK